MHFEVVLSMVDKTTSKFIKSFGKFIPNDFVYILLKHYKAAKFKSTAITKHNN